MFKLVDSNLATLCASSSHFLNLGGVAFILVYVHHVLSNMHSSLCQPCLAESDAGNTGVEVTTYIISKA